MNTLAPPHGPATALKFIATEATGFDDAKIELKVFIISDPDYHPSSGGPKK